MAARRNSKARSLATKSAELAVVAPQVAAYRLTRMATTSLSARDRKEFRLMGEEKVAAFMESWNAMAWQAIRANQALAFGVLDAFWSPWAMANPSARAAAQLQSATLGILSQGIAPIHRKAAANAKRLARARLR